MKQILNVMLTYNKAIGDSFKQIGSVFSERSMIIHTEGQTDKKFKKIFLVSIILCKCLSNSVKMTQCTDNFFLQFY